MPKLFQDFLQFIRERGVAGFAIGFIMGGSVSRLVASLVNDIIQPVIGLFFGMANLRAMRYLSINYGSFISEIINFLILAAVVFALFKLFKLEKLDQEKSE